MAKKLLIVESPAKAKTIEKYLGGDFSVKSSYGHIRDLEKGNDLGVDVANDYRPNYIVSPDKQKTVRELKEAANKSDEVWLATDEDREGEAISWHLCEVLGLDTSTTKRIVFHEITKPAIQKAILAPRNLDMNVVNAQQARRVLDRLVGWELSGLLWKKVKGQLSAGRVQSVSVKLVVERERDIQGFTITPYFKIVANFLAKNAQGKEVSFKAESPQRFDNPAGAEDFLKKCVGANYKVGNVEVKPTRRKPAPPFTTSTLQQEASRKIGFSVSRTMSVAQKLYEEGFITYMRTDSTNMSESALQAMGDEIVKLYGQKYHNLRRYKTKNDSAQEAHEAIRPTYMDRQDVSGNRDEQRLYELIWKRTMASQMADAELEKTIVDITISTQPQAKLVAEGEVLKFDGFLKVYLEGTDDEDEETAGILPPLKVGQPLDMNDMTATERYTRPPARFTEASLVKKLEELGIGRPSTYAPTISKIMEANRGYVVKESREGEQRTFQIFTLKNDQITKSTGKEITGTTKNVLYPLDMGMIVCDFLDEHFKKVMDYGFTASVEREFDDIAEGKIEWAKMIDRFYKPFHETVEKTLAEADRASGERILGVDPETGRTVLVRMSSLGKPVIQIGTGDELEKKEKPRYANLRPGQNLETVTLSDALGSFQLPRVLGEYEGEALEVNTGRYGPYVKFGALFISLPKGEDPFETTYERAVELLQAKQVADRPLGHFQNLPITKGKGRFGPFVKWADLYVNIPARFNFDTLTEPQAIEIIEQKIEKEANRYIQHWPEEKISVENGRWGPYIKYGKLIVNLPKLDAGAKMTADQARSLELAEVKKIIEKEYPGVFDAKKAPAKGAKAGAKTAAKKKIVPMSSEEILRDIKAKRFFPVYFLHGEEPFFIDQVAEAVEANALPEAERGFNQTVLYGKDVDNITLLDYLRRYPMMSERQVVILREAQEMKGLTELTAYLENPMPSTVFVVCHKHKKVDARTKFGKALLGKNIALLESKKLYDNQIADWISSFCKSHHMQIDAPAASLMAEYLGSDLSRIANELEKLTLNLPKGTAVNVGHVQEFVGISKDYNVFELQKALAQRDQAKVSRIQQYFAANIRKNPLVVTISSLYAYFSKVYMLHSLKGVPDGEVLKTLDLRSDWFLKEYKMAANNFSPSQTVAVLSLLKEYDLRSKGVNNDNTSTDEEALMKEMFWRMLHG